MELSPQHNKVMNTKIIEYNTKYLSPDIVQSCYQKGKHNLVDKLITGNGFTTGSLKLPTVKGQTDFIIVPNKKVVSSKQQSYQAELSNDKRIGFIYGDASSDSLDFDKFDVIMMVIDSFLLLEAKIRENISKVGRVLLDEVHSRYIQSTFRPKLVGFNKLIADMFSDKAVVSVTATPMLFQEPTIQLKPTEIEERIINISYQQKNTVKRLKERLANNEKCVVALQNARILKELVNKDGVLRANFKTGRTLFESILETAKVEVVNDSNLVIISSAGFEGFDITDGKYNIFVFEDRAFDFQTFFTENVYQVMGRPRQGTLYIEWNRISNRDRGTLPSLEEVKKKAASTNKSNEKKLTDKNTPYLKKYCTSIIENNSTGIITELEVDTELYNIDKELYESDTIGLSIYDKFFEDRGIKINLLNDGDSRLNKSTSSHKTKHRNVLKNKEIVLEGGYFADPFLDLSPKNAKTYQTVLNQYVSAYKRYLRRKYWDTPYLAWDERVTDEDVKDSDKFRRELLCLQILEDENQVKEGVKFVVKGHKSRKRDELGKDSKEYKQFCEEVEEKTSNIYPRLLMAISQGKVVIPKKTRNARDFNLLTECSMEMIESVAELFNVQVTETDIISCNLRILYAINGLSLPNNIYGENKKNKKKINKLLNHISIKFAEDYKTDTDDWKTNRTADLRKYGIDEKVIKYIMDNHFNNFKDSLYNLCINHEERIINKLMSRLIELANAGGYDVRFVRRHDSIISFGCWQESFDKALDQFTYQDIKGWFVQSDEEVKSSEEIAKEDVVLRVFKMCGRFNHNMQIIENKMIERERMNLEKERLNKLYLQNGKQLNLYQEAS